MRSLLEREGKLPVWLIVFIVIILLGVILGVIGSVKTFKEKTLKEETPPLKKEIATKSEQPKESSKENIVTTTLFSYKGEILKISSNIVQVKITKIENPSLNEDKIVKVKITDQTQLSQSDLSVSPIKSEKIKLENLKVGDKIFVVTKEEITDKTEFSAHRIIKLVK